MCILCLPVCVCCRRTCMGFQQNESESFMPRKVSLLLLFFPYILTTSIYIIFINKNISFFFIAAGKHVFIYVIIMQYEVSGSPESVELFPVRCSSGCWLFLSTWVSLFEGELACGLINKQFTKTRALHSAV